VATFFASRARITDSVIATTIETSAPDTAMPAPSMKIDGA